jgi:hypothetical protein
MRKTKRFVNTSITLRKDQLDIIDGMSIELSDWVRKRIDEHFNNPNHLSTEIKELEDKIDFLKKHQEDILLKKNIESFCLEDANHLFEQLCSTLKDSAKKGTDPKFIYNRFLSDFNKKMKTNKSMEDFKDLFQKWRNEFK